MILSKLYFFLYYYTVPAFSKLTLWFTGKWAPAQRAQPPRALSSKINYDFIQALLLLYFSVHLPPFSKLPLHFPEKMGPLNVCHLGLFS